MKRTTILLISVLFATEASAQTPDIFEIGPYQVAYYGYGDYEAAFIEGFDLYKYFNLQKDTTIVVEEKTMPLKNGVQINATMRVPILSRSMSRVIGVEASWKQRIVKNLFFNAGLSANVTTGNYFHLFVNESAGGAQNLLRGKMLMMEIGVPLSVEYTKLDKMKSSLYASVGVLPAYYKTLSGDFSKGVEGKPAKPAGIYVAPRLEVGAYIPAWGQLFKIGAYAQYNTASAVYKEFIGRAYAGGSVGIIF